MVFVFPKSDNLYGLAQYSGCDSRKFIPRKQGATPGSFQIFFKQKFEVNPHAVGQCFKMSPTSTSGFRLQFLFLCMIINRSHLCKVFNGKKGLKNFRKFISQEWDIIILS